MFNIVLEVLARPINKKKEKEKKNVRHLNQKGKSKIVPVADDMILYIENYKNPTKKSLGLLNEFSNVTEYKGNTEKSVAFLNTCWFANWSPYMEGKERPKKDRPLQVGR